jgi:hypothetical protein
VLSALPLAAAAPGVLRERETTTRARERASRFMNVRDIIKTHALIEKVSACVCERIREGGNSNCAQPNIFAYIMTPLKAAVELSLSCLLAFTRPARAPAMYIAFSVEIFQLSRPNGVGGRLVTWTQHEY